MKAIRIILLSLMILITFTSCGEDYACPEGIEGVWVLEKTVGGFAGGTYPAASDQESVLKISSSSYKEYKNGTLVLDALYEILPKGAAFDGSPQLLSLTPGGNYGLEYDKKTLTLDERDPDSFKYFYKRH